jgi:penicillin-binding protein 1A
MNIGIDGRGTLRAIVNLGSSGGASTLTQQLAKQLFHGEGSKFYPLGLYKSERVDYCHSIRTTIYQK